MIKLYLDEDVHKKIALSLRLKGYDVISAHIIFVDASDLKARKVAEDLGFSFSGSIGVLLKAEKLRLIDSALKKTQELEEKGFHVSNELLAEISKRKL